MTQTEVHGGHVSLCLTSDFFIGRVSLQTTSLPLASGPHFYISGHFASPLSLFFFVPVLLALVAFF